MATPSSTVKSTAISVTAVFGRRNSGTRAWKSDGMKSGMPVAIAITARYDITGQSERMVFVIAVVSSCRNPTQR